MARPLKTGLDYFPLDTVLNDKIELIEAEFGVKGFAVIVKLLQKIYGGQGYYCEWDNEVALMFTKRFCPDVGVNAVSEIVSSAVRRGVFDKCIFDKFGVLTSRGIQERFLEATKRRECKKIEECYLLINGAKNQRNASKSRINVYNNSINVCNNAIKESKVKKIKYIDDDSANDKTTVKIYNTEDEKFNIGNVIECYKKNINPLPTPTEYEELKYWADEGMEDKLMIACIKAAAMRNKRFMNYIKAMLKNLSDKGIKTFEQYQNAESIRNAEKEQNDKKSNEYTPKKTYFNNFEQRTYDKEDMKILQGKILEDYLSDEQEE